MPSQQNIEKVKEIKARLEDVEAAYFADFRGLSVPDIAEVRTALLEAEAQFSVLKNTLTRLALRELDLTDLERFLDGPTAVAFVKGDIVVGAKALVDAARKFDVLEVKGGLAEGRVLSAEDVKALASLQTREEMLATVAGLLSSQMRRAAFLFQALQSKFVSLLHAYAQKLEEEAPAAEEPEPEVPTEEPEKEGGEEAAPAEEPAAAPDETTEQEQEPEQEEG
jgi:large subunit ribosomal protein L10